MNPFHRGVLEETNTEACEIFFSWLVAFGKMLRYTSPERFPIYTLYIMHLRNVQVTQGRARQERARVNAGRASRVVRRVRPVVPTGSPFARQANADFVRAGKAPQVDVRAALNYLGSAPAQAAVAAFVDTGGHVKSHQGERGAFRLRIRQMLVEAMAAATGGKGDLESVGAFCADPSPLGGNKFAHKARQAELSPRSKTKTYTRNTMGKEA